MCNLVSSHSVPDRRDRGQLFKSVQCPHGLRDETLTQSEEPGPDSLQPPTRMQERKEVVGRVRGVQQDVCGLFDRSVLINGPVAGCQ